MSVVDLAIAVPLFALGAFIAWRGWGQGKWNLGPRAAAVAILSASTAVATLLSGWAATISGWLANLATQLASGIGQPQVGTVLRYVLINAPWLIGAGILALWVAAIIPAKLAKETMTWTIAFAGLAIPALLLTAPSWARTAEATVVNGVTAVATSIAYAGTAKGLPATGHVATPAILATGHSGHLATEYGRWPL